MSVTLNFEAYVVNTGYRIVWVYRYNDCCGHSNSSNLGHNGIEMKDSFVEETQWGGDCGYNFWNERCVSKVHSLELLFVVWILTEQERM